MSKRDSLCQHDGIHINADLIPAFYEDRGETNADRQAYRDEVFGSSFDANCIDDININDVEDVPVLDYRGVEIGVKSVIRKRKRRCQS